MLLNRRKLAIEPTETMYFSRFALIKKFHNSRNNRRRLGCQKVLLLALVIAWGFTGGESLVAKTSSPITEMNPNVLLIVVDDLGYQDLGCYNKTCHYQTTAIDRLASSGVRFTQFYSAHPVCSPTRAAVMTGKAPQRVGITQWIPQPSNVHLPLEEKTIGEAFSSAGYRTGYIGKWHLGEKDAQQPTAHGFSWMRAVNRAGQPGSYFFPFQRSNKNKDKPNYWDVPDLSDRSKGSYLTDGLTDLAIDFLSDDDQRPFFLCLSHYAVHTPIQSPPQLVKKYKQKFESKFSDPAKTIREPRGAMSRPRLDDPEYAAMVENLDANIQRLLKTLKSSEATKNTIVVFTSDNGGLSTLPKRVGPTSCRPFRAGKGWIYEGGIRIPTIISWQGNLEHRTVSLPAISMDLYPTLLELANLKLKPKQHVDGVSLVQSLRGEKQQPERTMAWHYPHRHGSGHRPASAIRDGKWKLIHHWETNEYELFDLEKDVSEETNRIADQEKIAARLKRKLSEWVKETNSK